MTEQATIDSRVAHELEVEEPDARVDDLVAGELAICAALANGRFIEAHRQNRLHG